VSRHGPALAARTVTGESEALDVETTLIDVRMPEEYRGG
jgi:hypothetical protein